MWTSVGGFTMLLLLLSCLLSIRKSVCEAADTITTIHSIKNGDTIVSSGGSFEMGFFSPGNSKNRYMGIWYKETLPVMTVVWVANRKTPLTDISFDYPSDTLLPGMKLGKNFEAGLQRYLSSWKSNDDPSPGDFTYHCDPSGYPQNVMRNGSVEQYRIGSRNGVRFTGVPNLCWNAIFWKIPLDCYNSWSDGFLKYSDVKLPDTRNSLFNVSMTLEECQKAYSNNCSCMAYANLDIRNGGNGCLLWFGDLIDIRDFPERAGQDIYVRMASSDSKIGTKNIRGLKSSSNRKKRIAMKVSLPLSAGVLLLGIILTVYVRKRKKNKLLLKREGR
ncbi:hypothetical protein RJ639_003809 [Escallonia herrerae]|uniref:Uncharacterized protein n=1 Tax=Escallonia herrerae TaxID=1293975 RepID=A0AA88W151_9ASTE|nr:hypothetical protein RJ639_003809 [Escallonia herrerae]